MADSIRERIIAAIAAKLAEIQVANGYVTELGDNVYRGITNIPTANMPAIAIFPRVESSSREYGKQACVMPVEIKGLQLMGTSNPSTLGEQMLADLINCLLGNEYTRTFTSGGTYQVVVGNTVTGATSGATGKVVGVTLTSGSWAAGNAAGTLRFKTVTGTFVAENLNVGANLNVATIAAGGVTTISAKDISGGNLVDDIAYAGGGVEDYPAMKDEAVIVGVVCNVSYVTVIGNPYSQT